MKTFALMLVGLPVVLALYAYLVYPAILRLLPGPGGNVVDRLPDPPPLVTVVIPAYNEEEQIRGAIESQLSQDYPPHRRQILILSDASSDRTEEIVREYAARGVELLRMETRKGKTAAENASIPHIRGQIVVNTDASIRMHPAAVRSLVGAMSDPGVGVASSRDVSTGMQWGPDSSAEAGYVGYEMWIRRLETRVGGIVGASGSGYAIRAELHAHPVRSDLSRDFSAALTARRHGFAAVSVESAVCYVPRTASLRTEYRRKVRTISRGMETLYFNRDLLDFTTHGLFAWKLISHKLIRWLVPVSGIPAVVGLALLAASNTWSLLLLGLAALGAGLAILGARWPDSRPMPVLLPATILGALAANLAVVHAAWRFFKGHEDHVWEPTRRTSVPRAG